MFDESASPSAVGVQLTANNVQASAFASLGFAPFDWTFDAPQIELEADSHGNNLAGLTDKLSLHAQAEGASVNYLSEPSSTNVTSLSFELRSRPGEPLTLSARGIHENFPLKLDLSIDNAAAAFADEPISVTATTKSSHASVSFSGNIAAPRTFDGVSVHIKSEGSRFEILHPSLWLPWEQTGPFHLTTDLEYVDHQLTLSNLDALTDDYDVRGTIVIPTDADGRVDVRIESNAITIGDVLEPEDGDVVAISGPYVLPSFPLARMLPSNWNGDFQWHIDSLQLHDSVFKNLKVEGQLESGRLRVNQTGVTHPNNGPFELALLIDPQATPPARLKVSAEDFDLGWILPNEVGAKPHWPSDIHIDLSGPADTFQQLMGDADGVIEFSGGQTTGAEFEKWDLNLLSRMLPRLGSKPKDQINCMVVNMDVDDGVATGDGAVLETQHAIVAGGGALDLRTERLGLVLSAQPKDKTLLDVTASLRVEGTLHDPEIELISTDVAFGATQILLGVANPFSLLGSFVLSSGDNANTACETALRAAQEKDARGSTIGESNNTQDGGLFDFLLAGSRESKDE